MLRRLIRRIFSGETRAAAGILYAIANLRDSERMAREKGYTDAADRILGIRLDLEREFGSDPNMMTVAGRAWELACRQAQSAEDPVAHTDRGEFMYSQVELQRAGGALSVTLPQAMLKRHHLDAGDRLCVIDTADGILVTPYDPTFTKAMNIAGTGAKRYRDALRKLAE